MDIERYFHTLWTNQTLDAVAAVAAAYGLYVVLACAAAAWVRGRPRGTVLPFALGAAACAAIVWIAGALHDETRPFVALGVAPLVPHGVDNAFPSDHSAAAAFAATAAVFLDPLLGIAAWIATLALGIGRAYCLLHTPGDVIAGWVIGALPAIAAGLVSRAKTPALRPPRRT